jgi:hypothetical protein
MHQKIFFKYFKNTNLGDPECTGRAGMINLLQSVANRTPENTQLYLDRTILVSKNHF